MGSDALLAFIPMGWGTLHFVRSFPSKRPHKPGHACHIRSRLPWTFTPTTVTASCRLSHRLRQVETGRWIPAEGRWDPPRSPNLTQPVAELVHARWVVAPGIPAWPLRIPS